MDLIHFVAKVGNAVGFIQRIGKDVNHRSPDGILSGGRYEIHLFKSFGHQALADFLIGKPLSCADGEQSLCQFALGRQLFFQGLGISDNK